VSSLTVTTEPWVALPSPDTTLEQLSDALKAFPNLRINLGPEFDVSLVVAKLHGAEPPPTDALAGAMYGDADPELLVAEETGEHLRLVEESFDQEAKDRNAEGV
jgi:hypothetical protein